MIKQLIKCHLKKTPIYRRRRINLYAKQKKINGKIKCIYSTDKYRQFDNLLENLRFSNIKTSRFIYWIHKDIYFYNECSVIGNMPLDYSLIIENSIEELIEKNKAVGNNIAKKNIKVLISIKKFVERIVAELKNSEDLYLNRSSEILQQMLYTKALSIQDALQRILFWNQLMHQTGHTLVGLGRLDKMLDRVYQEISNEELEELPDILNDFIKTLHEYYYWKSCSLFGDTGQIIILGGLDQEQHYFCNGLTYLFLDAIGECKFPDPKILLRVSNNMPRELLQKACHTVAQGTGSPLFSNDEVIINKLSIAANYKMADSYEYATSACWEPFIPGKSFDQNNVKCINFLEPLNTLLINSKNPFSSFDDLKKSYAEQLKRHCRTLIKEANQIRWEEDPLLTLFCEECLKSDKGIHEGGAFYNNYGFTSTGLANTVNSLLNIKYYCFDSKTISIKTVTDAFKHGRLGDLFSFRELKEQPLFWGKEDNIVKELANWIIKQTRETLIEEKNQLNGIFKFGLSSPSYIDCGTTLPASMDGRKAGEPLSVHISTMNSVSYTEFIAFASSLDYNSTINGNVVDLMLAPSFVETHFEKFTDFIALSIKRGFFQMQMNVVSADTLIAAQKEPQKYPYLIVRVWGFSAYFNEIPEQYQNVLIKRALEHEGRIEEAEIIGG